MCRLIEANGWLPELEGQFRALRAAACLRIPDAPEILK
jgi:hypothetical protein